MFSSISKWDGVSEPILDNAIMALRPDAISWRIIHFEGTMIIDNWVDQNNSEAPHPEEVLQKFKELMELWKYDEYKRKRIEMYGTIGEQLDMLYKDIKSGNLMYGEWVNHIESVKDSIPVNTDPKPDYTY